MSLYSRLALQFSLEGVVFSLMNENLSHKRKEIEVMTTVETGGRCSNANMCHHIILICDHAKVTITKILRIKEKENVQSVFIY